MKRFLIQLALFSILVLGSIHVFGVEVERGTYKSNYMLSLIDKHKRAASFSGRRVLLAGGSNLAFGVDSKKIEEALQLPVTNMSLHAGLGLDFILNEMRHVVRPGDIVLLSTEYYVAEGDDDLKENAVEGFPEAKFYYSQSPLRKVKAYYTKRVEHMNDNAIHTPGIGSFFNVKEEAPHKRGEFDVYAREYFNAYGDAIGHHDRQRPSDTLPVTPLPYRYYEGIDKLNDFYQFCKEKRVAVYYFYPVLAESQYKTNVASLTRYEQDFARDLRIPVLNKPTTFVLADSLFYDTVYHLTKEGRTIRTNKMVQALLAAELTMPL